MTENWDTQTKKKSFPDRGLTIGSPCKRTARRKKIHIYTEINGIVRRRRLGCILQLPPQGRRKERFGDSILVDTKRPPLAFDVVAARIKHVGCSRLRLLYLNHQWKDAKRDPVGHSADARSEVEVIAVVTV